MSRQLPRIAFQNWIAARQHDCLTMAREDGMTAQEIAADLRLSTWLEQAANPYCPYPVALINWAALGLASQHLAEGRN